MIQEEYSYAVRFGNERPFVLREKLHPTHHKSAALSNVDVREKKCLGKTMLKLIVRSLPGFVNAAKNRTDELFFNKKGDVDFTGHR